VRQLHFGCGPNRLPAPWENFDREVNIAEPLPFPDGSARYIFAEHVIEHVPFLSGMAFLTECVRVLEPGGVLRFAFPDASKFFDPYRVEEYCRFLKQIRPSKAADKAAVFRFILLDNGHQAAWTEASGIASAIAAGFASTKGHDYGCTGYEVFDDVDGHHKSSPVAEIETTVIEAIK
jgi:predicted SAM-dependent methyltransferase